jgi:hypothetical protein
MLCGLIPPTDGAMTVFGRDVTTNLASIRKDLGVCPQHVSGGGRAVPLWWWRRKVVWRLRRLYEVPG